MYNSTPFGHINSVGDKDAPIPTDLHSIMARRVGVPRGIAKNMDYGIQFGAGKKTTTNTILSGNRLLPIAEAEDKAEAAIINLKGKMVSHDNINYNYNGGLASHCFNKMMERGDAFIQSLPLSGQEYPLTLQKRYTQKDFILTRNNLQIQGSGKNLLEVLMLLTKYFCDMHNIDATFLLSIHDSLAYEVKEEQVLEFAACLQMAHLYAWASLRYSLDIFEIGIGGAFLSGIEVGDFFMKSSTSNTVTRFNQHGETSVRSVLKIENILPTIAKLFG